MKICLGIPKGDGGGSATFLRNFQEYMTRENHPFTTDMDEESYDILFVNSWTIPYPTILQHKKRLPRLRVAHRIDGSAQDYGRNDGADWLQRDVNALADVTIYQSQYSYDATHTRHKLIEQEGTIIYNPVDTTRFSPNGIKFDWPDGIKRLISVGWSPNPRKGTWRIPQLARQNPDIEFVVVGKSDTLVDLPNIRKISYLNHDELPKALRSADIYLSLLENDACPNVILEAMACGLPVLFLPSGGVPELVGDAGLPFAPEGNFRAILNHLLDDLADYAQKARQRTLTLYHPNVIFPQYLDVIEASRRRPMPPPAVTTQAYLDQQAFDSRLFLSKWQRILTGKQPLRNPNKRKK